MRKLVLAAALTGTMLTLAACSGAADETTDAADTAEVEATEDAAAVETAAVLDANTATAEQLAGTEGVSAELAAAIVALADPALSQRLQAWRAAQTRRS